MVLLAGDRIWVRQTKIIQQAVACQDLGGQGDQFAEQTAQARFGNLAGSLLDGTLNAGSGGFGALAQAVLGSAGAPSGPGSSTLPLADAAASGPGSTSKVAAAASSEASAAAACDDAGPAASPNGSKAKAKVKGKAKAAPAGDRKVGAPRRDSHCLLTMKMEELANAEAGDTRLFGTKWLATGTDWRTQLSTTEAVAEVRAFTKLTVVGGAVRTTLNANLSHGSNSNKTFDIYAREMMTLQMHDPPFRNPFPIGFRRVMHNCQCSMSWPASSFWALLTADELMKVVSLDEASKV